MNWLSIQSNAEIQLWITNIHKMVVCLEFSTVLLTVAAQEDNGSGLLIIRMQSPSKNEDTQEATRL